jgi:putative effector of murein hydrolase
VAAALLAGSVTAAGSAVALGAALGLDPTMLRTLAPKSVTSPIAMAVSEQMGGIPALAAVFVILTGILGALFGPLLFALMRVRSSAAKGLALGVVTHGIGTARAMQIDPVAGAFAALGMGLNGVVTAVVLPWLG